MFESLFKSTKGLEKAIAGTWKRNEAIAQNIANVDTPGYKRKTVSFEEALSEALDSGPSKETRTDPRHVRVGPSSIDDVRINVSEDNTGLSTRLDGNNVDIESEMAAMAKNTIQYNTLVQSLNAKFRSLKSVIRDGK